MIDKDTIEKILDMSRINVKQESKDSFVKKVSDIIQFVENINKIDTSSVMDEESVFDEKNVFRNDDVGVSLGQPELRKYTKNYFDGYYAVPKIIEKKEETKASENT